MLRNKNKRLQLKTKNAYLMIEILISLVIFSVAIIALVSLQISSYSSVQSSSSRTIATNYAYDMADKMRSNKTGVISGAYLSGTTGTDNNCRSVNYNTVHAAVACTPAQMAQDDLREFTSQVATSLPSGAAVICLDSQKSQGTPTTPNCDGTGNAYVIKIFWKDSISKKMGTNDGYAQVILGAQL